MGARRARLYTSSLQWTYLDCNVCGRSFLPQNTGIGRHRHCDPNALIRTTRLAFIRGAHVPRGTSEWLARVDRGR